MVQLSHFTITAEIHQSSDTVLYRGYRNADRAPVVIKLPRGDTPDPKVLAKLRHEHAILKDLSLAGIVRTCGLEKHGRSLALVLEDLGGTPLDVVLKTKQLDLRSMLEIAASIAGALSFIHRRGIIHKDIKPHNILVQTDTWTAQLIDFGIATRLSRETHGAEHPGTLEGTLAYMSPEQTGRMNRALDDRTDLYSLGVTLYEMTTGILPFRSTDPVELVHGHIARMPAPPHEVAHAIPPVLSDIVMKLLAKAAEDRYQTASGLAADLHECIARLSATGRIDAFPLGTRDRSGKLRFTRRLQGREKEAMALRGAWERATRGAAELFLVSGYAGVGKSVLIQEMHRFVARDGGHFIAGKFDQLDRGTPYAPFARALRELIQDLLSEPAEALAGWKIRIKTALGSNGQILVDLIPELELLIGPQPSVPPLGPTESQNRFALVFQSFLRALATREHPLAVFLDDLQWVDPASLNLLQQILTDPDRGYLLLLGAYRDNEVDGAHPLRLAVKGLEKAGAALSEITLQPLSLQDATQFVADALGAGKEQIEPLAKLVWTKTHGNPFFLSQFLEALEQEGLLAFDARSGGWLWDTARIRQRMVTDNVADLIAGKILRLPENTRQVLKLAACMGHRFDLSALSVIVGKSLLETAADLWEALREGLIVPLNAEYRFLDGHTDHDEDAAALSQTFHVSYRFLHDRVQQATYSLVDEGERQAVHLGIGRFLLARSGSEPRDEALFEVTNHLNLGAAQMEDPGERLTLARLNLAAGRKARASAAYQAAVSYLEAGLSLGETGWNDEGLSFALRMERAECELSMGAFDTAASSLDVLLAHARGNLEKARVHKLRIAIHGALRQFGKAIEGAQAALALFGISLPMTAEARKAAADAELAEARAQLAGRRIEDLRCAPRMTDPDTQAAVSILAKLSSTAYVVDSDLYAFITARALNLSLQYGQADSSPSTYASYAVILCNRLGAFEEAFDYSKLSVALCEKLDAIEHKCRVLYLFAYVRAFREPLRSSLPTFEQAHSAGLASGDLVLASYALWRRLEFRLRAGDELGDVEEEADEFLALMQRTKNKIAEAGLRISKQMILNLTGRTRDRSTLSDGTFDEASFAAALQQPHLAPVAPWYYALKIELLTIYGDHEDALAMTRLAEEKNSHIKDGLIDIERIFFTCLIHCALYPTRTAAEQQRLAAELDAHQQRLARCADACPESFLHKKLLVEAERARIEGRELVAINLYGAAIERAGRNELYHHEALANELAAKFHLAQGRTQIASYRMRDAYQGYLRWGATAKAADLAGKYPQWLLQPPGVSGRERAELVTTTATTTGNVIAMLDMTTVSRAAQTIAGEIVHEKVLDRLMRLLIEYAGAQRGVLLLGRDGQLTIEAKITVDPDDVTVGPPVPVRTSADVPLSVVHYVERTLEPVVLGDARDKSRFAGDPYIAERRPKSLLCLAMMHQGKLTGILYLENNAATDVFTKARIDVCALLSSQAAIAIENARLVAHAKAAADELRRMNEALEERIAHRTKELSQANERLLLELGERERAEAERARLQEEIIRAQTERLSEMSTPLIPITDRIVVMPLIGTVDAERAQQMLETALTGAQARKAAVVILDITGVKVVDTGVAAMLMSTAAALRLLGAHAVLTGIRPDVARTLVGLDVDLASIVTKATLQQGIAYALRRSGAG